MSDSKAIWLCQSWAQDALASEVWLLGAAPSYAESYTPVLNRMLGPDIFGTCVLIKPRWSMFVLAHPKRWSAFHLWQRFLLCLYFQNFWTQVLHCERLNRFFTWSFPWLSWLRDRLRFFFWLLPLWCWTQTSKRTHKDMLWVFGYATMTCEVV